jgi:hypothetical protein
MHVLCWRHIKLLLKISGSKKTGAIKALKVMAVYLKDTSP